MKDPYGSLKHTRRIAHRWWDAHQHARLPLVCGDGLKVLNSCLRDFSPMHDRRYLYSYRLKRRMNNSFGIGRRHGLIQWHRRVSML